MTRDLKVSERKIRQVGKVDEGRYLVQWTVEFCPAKLAFLLDFANALNCSIERRDILDKMRYRPKFTWQQLFKVLRRMVFEKKYILTVTRIEGRSVLTFDEKGQLVDHEESLALVRCVNDGLVQNKRICRDLLEYFDMRNPRGINLRDWDVMVADKVDIFSVPGMRTSDVDGLEDQQENIEDLTAVLGFITLATLCFGVFVGSQYFIHLKQEAVYRQIMEEEIVVDGMQ